MSGRADRFRAARRCREGARLLPVDPRAAEAAYREAVELDPELGPAWFDLGLIGKFEGRWDLAFEANERAAAIAGPRPEDPAWWNLGIAATALRRWDVARHAWRTFGLQIADGTGPIEQDFGPTPVRIDPGGLAEVVWGRRVDPARIRIESVPFPGSGHRWGDIVLHDGAPRGHRSINGITVPVFDELARWEPSTVATLEAVVAADDPNSIVALLDAVVAAGYGAEDWTANVRQLCVACSEGSPTGHHHSFPPPAAFDAAHALGIAAPQDVAEALLAAWATDPGCRVISIDPEG